MANLIGDVTLTFKRLSEERPKFCVVTRERLLGTKSFSVRKQSDDVLVASRDGLRFMVACLDMWNAGTLDEHLYWLERGSGYLVEDLEAWSTWAALPLKEGAVG